MPHCKILPKASIILEPPLNRLKSRNELFRRKQHIVEKRNESPIIVFKDPLHTTSNKMVV